MPELRIGIHRTATVLALLCPVLAFGQTFRWANPAGGLTSVPSNWVGGSNPPTATSVNIEINSEAFPTPGAPLTLPISVVSQLNANTFNARANLTISTSGILTVNGNGSVIQGQIQQQTGFFNGTGSITVTGPYVMTGGTLAGTGLLTLPSGITLQSTGTLNVQKPIDAQGTSAWTSGVIFGSQTGLFRNLGTMTVSGSEWQNGRFTNQGTLVKSGTGTTRFNNDTLFTNTGQIQVQAGTLRIDRFETAAGGTYAVANGATLLLTPALTTTMVDGASVTGLGALETRDGGAVVWEAGANSSIATLRTVTGTLNFQAGSTVQNEPTVVLNPGTLRNAVPGARYGEVQGSGLMTLDANTVVTRTLNFGGQIFGAGSLEVLGPMTFSSGQMGPGGTLFARGGLHLTTLSGKDLRRAIEVSGASSWTQGPVFGQSSFLQSGSWAVSAPESWKGGSVTNSGTLTKTGTGITRFNSDTLFSNSGSVQVESGTLRIDRLEPISAGAFGVGSGALLILTPALTATLPSGASVSGLGTLETRDGGAVVWEAGATSSIATLRTVTGTLNFQTGSTVQNEPTVVLNPGTLRNAVPGARYGEVQGSGLMTLDANTVVTRTLNFGGQIFGAGSLEVLGPMTFSSGQMGPGGTLFARGGLHLTSPSGKDLRRVVDVSGASSWTQGPVFGQSSFIQRGDWSVTAADTWQGGSVTNAGTLTRTGAGTTTFSGAGFLNSGTVSVAQGSLNISQFSASAQTGQFQIASGAQLEMGGASTLGAGSKVVGAGTLRASNGIATFTSGSELGVPQILGVNGGVALQTGATLTSTPRITLETGSFATGAGVSATLHSVEAQSSTLNLGGTTTIQNQLVLGGDLQGAGNVTVQGPWTWQRGRLQPGGTVTAQNGATWTTPETKVFDRPVTLRGTSSWTGGTLFGDVFRNEGTLTIAHDGLWQRGQWTNAGTLIKEGSSGTATLNSFTSLTNAGTVIARSGTLDISSSSAQSGTFRAEAGSQLVLRGAMGFQGTASLVGPGVKELRGEMSFGAGTFWDGPVRAESSTITVQPGATFGAGTTFTSVGTNTTLLTTQPVNWAELSLSGGTLSASGSLRVTGPATFTSGLMQSAGGFLFDGGLTLSGPSSKRITGNMEMRGMSQWTQGLISMSTGNLIRQFGELEVSAAGDWSGGVFNNVGTLRKTGIGEARMAMPGSGTGTALPQFSNTGEVIVTAGSLRSNGWGSHTGLFQVASGAKLAFDGAQVFRNGSVLRGSTVRFESGLTRFETGSSFEASFETAGGTVTFLPGSNFAPSSPLNLSFGGTLELRTGVPFQTPQLVMGRGLLSGTDPVTVTQTFTMTGGQLGGSGGLAVAPNASASFSGTQVKTLSAPLQLQGTSTVGAGPVTVIGGEISNSGTMTFQDGANWTLGTLRNLGSLRKSEGNNEAVVNPDVFESPGEVRVSSGRLVLGGLLPLRGQGRLTGGRYEVSGMGRIRLQDATQGIIENEATIALIGENALLETPTGGSALATLELNQGSLVVDGPSVTIGNTLVNQGLLEVTKGSLGIQGNLSVDAGTVNLEGELTAQSVLLQGGQVRGNGLLSGNVVNASEINPGDGIGALTVQGSYTQSPSGRLVIEIGAGFQNASDRLSVVGNVSLNGQLQVNLNPLIVVPNGTRYRILEWTGTRTGTFSILPPPSGWSVVVGANNIEIVRISPSNTVTVSGRVSLGSYGLTWGVPPVSMEMFAGGQLVQLITLTPTADGNWAYSFETDRQGAVSLFARVPLFLRQGRNFSIGPFGASNVNFQPVPGDANNDGIIDGNDVNEVLANFGSESPTPDLNGDGIIDGNDINVVLANFGAEGE